MKKRKYWAGFCDGKIAVIQNLSGMNIVELFTNKKHGKRFFQDVRAVEIKEYRRPKEE